ncbi:hypothetical protein ACFL0P_04090 [Candidatus Omnitrophota bacterium]
MEWDGIEQTRSIDVFEGNVYSESSTAESTLAGELFTDDIIRYFNKQALSHDDEVVTPDLQTALSSFGVDNDTLIITVETYRNILVTGDGQVQFQEGFSAYPTTIYLLPNDPLGRVLAVETRGRSEGELTSSLIINMLWVDNEVPLGGTPGSFVLELDKDRRITAFEFVIFDRIIPKGGLNLELSGRFYDPEAGVDVNPYSGVAYEYRVVNGGLRKHIIFSTLDQVLAERYDFVVARPARGFLGIATLGQETIYYNPTLPYQIPLRAITSFDKQVALDIMDIPRVEGTLWDGSRGDLFNIGRGEFIVIEDGDDIIRVVTKDNYIITFSLDEQGRQVTVVRAMESEGLNVATLHEQESTFIDGDLINRERPDIMRQWLSDKAGWTIGLGVFGGIIIVTIATGTIMPKIEIRARKRRETRKAQETTPPDDSIEPDEDEILERDLDVLRITAIEMAIGHDASTGFDSYGFDEEVVKHVKKTLLIPRIKQGLRRGDSIEEIVQEFFKRYEEIWLDPVLGRDLDIDVTGLAAIENMYLRLLIYASGSHFSNTCETFLHYLFYASKERLEKGEAKSDIGYFVKEEVKRWVDVLLMNATAFSGSPAGKRAGKEAGFAKRLTIDDIADFFRSPSFISWYEEEGREEVDTYLATEPTDAAKELLTGHLKKTYHDVSKGFLGWKGWLAVFRNYSKIFAVVLFTALVASFTLVIFIPTLTFGFWITCLAVIAGTYFLAHKGAGLAIKKLQKDTVGEWSEDTVFPGAGRKTPDATRGRKIRAAFVMAVTLTLKFVWNALIWTFIGVPLATAFYSTFLVVGGNLVLLGLVAVPFILFFLLDIFAFFYIAEGVIGYLIGKYHGVGKIKSWRGIRSNFGKAAGEFQKKILPPTITGRDGRQRTMTEDEKEIAWAKAWNSIIHQFYEEDRMSEEERNAYSYGIIIDQDNYLGGEIVEKPDLSKAPENERVRRRLQHFMSTLFMDMDQMPTWDKMYLFSVITPCYKEVIMYLFDDKSQGDLEAINEEYKTGSTFLTYIISKHKTEWENFINRMEVEQASSPEDIEKLRNLRYGEKLDDNISDDLKLQVRLWASYRYQPLARTIRGVMNYREMYKFQAQVNFPTMESLERSAEAQDAHWQGKTYEEIIDEKVDGKFEYIVGHQPYGDLAETDQLRIDMNRMLRIFPHLKVAYLGTEAGEDGQRSYYGALLQLRGGVITETARVPLSGHFFFGQGKPVNQNNLMKFVRGEIVQFMDMNQDMYLEETFKGPCLSEEFRKNPDVAIVGLPEDIITDEITPVGRMHAFADRSFNTLVQRTLNWMGVRFHYGHPDYLRVNSVRQLGLIIPPYVNEDIFGGYKATLYGEVVTNKEIMQAGKAREGDYAGHVGISQKFAAGGVEQAMTRWLERLNTSSVLGFSRAFMHFVAALGYFLRKPVVALTVTAYLFTVLLLGVSGFVALPSELLFGIYAIFMSQAITFTGVFELILERGVFKGVKDFLVMFPSLLLQFGSLLYTSFFPGAIQATLGEAGYVATGRVLAREHELPFNPEGGKDVYGVVNKIPRGISFAVAGAIMSIAGIYLWQSVSIIWSFFFIAMTFSAILAGFIMNPGSLPWNMSFGKWIGNYVNDTKNTGIYILKKLIAGGGELANGENNVGRNRFTFILATVAVVAAAFLAPSVTVPFAVFFAAFTLITPFRNVVNVLVTAVISTTVIGVVGIAFGVLVNLPTWLGLKIRVGIGKIFRGKLNINKIIANTGWLAGIGGGTFAIVKYAAPFLLLSLPAWAAIAISVGLGVIGICFLSGLFTAEQKTAEWKLDMYERRKSTPTESTYPARFERIGYEELTPDIDAVVIIDGDSITFEYKPESQTTLGKEEEEILMLSLRNWIATLDHAPPQEIPIFVSYNLDQVAEHKPERIEINRALLRAPPSNKKAHQLFVDGVIWHEGYHLLNPTQSEPEAQQATLEYFDSRPDIRQATINVLNEANQNLIHGLEWLGILRQHRASKDSNIYRYVEILREAADELGDERIDRMVSDFIEKLLQGEEVLIGHTAGDPVMQVKIILDGKGSIKDKKLQIHYLLLDNLVTKKGSKAYDTYKEILKALLIKESGHYETTLTELNNLAQLKRDYMSNPQDREAAKRLASMQMYYEEAQYRLLYEYLTSKGINPESLDEILDEIEKQDAFLGDLLRGLSTLMRNAEQNTLLAVAKDLSQGTGYIGDSIRLALTDKAFEDDIARLTDRTGLYVEVSSTKGRETTTIVLGASNIASSEIFSLALARNIYLDLASQKDIEAVQGLAIAVSSGYKGEDLFKEQGGYIFGIEQNGKYTITRFVPFRDISVSRENYVEPSEQDIRKVMAVYAKDGIKLIGLYHNHSFVKLTQGQRPGASGQDLNFCNVMREMAVEIAGDESVAEELIGLVIEPKLNEARFMELAWNPEDALRLYRVHIDEIMIYAYMMHDNVPVILDPVEFHKTIFRIDKKLHEDKTLTLA